MHDTQEKQNCEGASISENAQNKRNQYFKKKWRTQCCGQIFIYLMYQEMEKNRGEEQGKEEAFISRLVEVRAKNTEGC